MNIIVLLALIVGTYAETTAFPFPDECTSGPSYWCHDMITAQSCGAIQHCLTAVWMKQKVNKAAGQSDQCTYCETVVTEVRLLMDNKQSVAEIQKVLEKACARIPKKSAADKCNFIVHNDLPGFLTTVASALDPKMVCSLLGLCESVEDNIVHLSLSKPSQERESAMLSTDTLCKDCEKTVKDLKEMVSSNRTKQFIENFINTNFCAYLGPLTDECKTLSATYIDQLFAMMQQRIDPAWICKMVGFCLVDGVSVKRANLLKDLREHMQGKASSEKTCLMCKSILTELQTLDRDPAVQKNVEDLLKQEICGRLGSFKAACESLVDQYLPILFELIINELDPEIRCKSMGLCPANQISTGHHIAAAPLQSILRQGLVMPQPDKHVQVMSKARASSSCIMCEFVIKELAQIMSSNSSEKAIMKALKKVCTILPKTVKDECNSFVTQYGPAVIALIQAELKPQQICTSLGLCHTSSLNAETLTMSPETCGICQTVIQYIDSLLEENATSQEIISAVEKVCNIMPASYKTQCDKLIEKYGPTIILLLEQLVDPKDVCTYIGLCDKTSRPAVIKEENVVRHKRQLVGENKCTWGPGYWCGSLESAKECKAVQHCVKHVWSKKKGQ